MQPIASRIRSALAMLLAIFLPGSLPAHAVGAPVVAEAWPAGEQANPTSSTAAAKSTAAARSLEMGRRRVGAGAPTKWTLDKLEIPARETPSLVRVRGVLLPPATGGYTINIYGTDPAELWLADDATGEWTLAQRNGNPNTGANRLKLEQGVPRRFELWATGTKSVSVQWEAAARDEGGRQTVSVAKTAISATCMAAPSGKEGDRLGIGLHDAWKQRWGLDGQSGDGPNGPWGDPDEDGLLNWQEQLAGTDPRKADAEGIPGFVRWEIWRDVLGQYVFDLTRSARFPQQPDALRYLHRLEIPVGNGNDYGSRVRGFIKAPATGEYTFMVIANDTAELWLGETEAPESRRCIASAEQPGPQRKWTRRTEQTEQPLLPEQVSARITLEQGRTYYVELLHKQDTKEDHCAVAWVLPGETKSRMIEGDSLISWKPALNTLAGDAAPESPHALTAQSWDNLPGNSIKDLVLTKDYPARPSSTTLVDNLDFSDEGDTYGCRLRGYLTAPDDGPYLFQISGNDACMLWLAESGDKFTKRVVAQTTGGTVWRDYRGVTQQSEPIELKKGQKYSIEVLFKRGERLKGSGLEFDHASVAWKRPGRHGLPATVIAAEHFSPYRLDSRDADDDDLPDDWEKAHGLDPSDPSGDNGAWGDPDGDWLENFREFQMGFDPKAAEYRPPSGLAHWQGVENFREFQLPLDPRATTTQPLAGFALWECWENLPGGRVAALEESEAFPHQPTQRKWVSSLEGPVGMGKNYGSRLRAYVVPPVSGNYLLAIAGDDESELWLSQTAEKFDKQLIARVTGGTRYRQWDSQPGQVSRMIRLEAGRRYFIEVRHKQESGSDHVSVAWRVPGSNEFRVIRDQALLGFTGDAHDLNDDDVPDDWEKANGISTTLPRQDRVDRFGNGLTNRERFLYLTRPGLANSVADAILYSQEVALGQSQEAPATAVAFTPLTTLRGDAYSASFGPWEKKDGQAWQTGRRGSVTYPLTVTRSGVHALKFMVSSRAGGDLDEAYDFRISLNGLPISYQTATIAENGKTSLAVLTPWLNAGESYQIEIFVDNSYMERRVSVDEVSILAASGPDTNGNGIPEWVETRLRENNGFDQRMIHSRTSPATVEGRARYTEMAKAGDIVLNKAPNGRFFAEVPLAPGAPANLEFAFENGGLTQTARVHWQPTNLRRQENEPLTIRQGDSLLLTAYRNDEHPEQETYTLGVNGQAVNNSADHPTPVAFPTAGPQAVDLSHRSADGKVFSRRFTVNVLPRVAIESPLCVTGFPRLWTHSPLPAGAGIQFDSNITALPEQTANTYTLATAIPQNQPLLVRYGTDGPILGGAEVKSVRVRSGHLAGNIYESIGELVSTARMYVVVSGDLAGAEIRCDIIIGGVTFTDGTTRKSLWTADLDELGVGSLLFLKANSAHANCRKFSAWKDGVRVADF